MKFKLFIVTIISFLLSCSNDKKEEIVDLSELTTSSERYKEGKTDNQKNLKAKGHFSDSLKVQYKAILDSLKIEDSIVRKLDIVSFPDRFGAKTITKLFWKIKSDSVTLIDWEFNDSLKTENAFYNWIDCFGKNCKTLKIGDKVKIQKRELLILVNEKHLMAIDSEEKIDYNKWISILKSQQFGESWKYILFQPKKGKSSWMNYKNEIITELNIKL